MDKKPISQLEIEMTTYPATCCLPIFFADVPSDGKIVNNGTITLFTSQDKVIGITCWHVIESYKNKLADNPGLILQVGNHKVDLEKQLIDHNSALDLATLAFTSKDHEEMRQGQKPIIGSNLLSIIHDNELTTNDRVSFAGFPGSWRKAPRKGHFIFDSFNIGECGVTTSFHDKFSCRIDSLDTMRKVFSYHDNENPTKAGGLSGGPVLLMRETNKIFHWELAGIIYQGEFINETLVIYARPARHIAPDGKIIK